MNHSIQDEVVYHESIFNGVFGFMNHSIQNGMVHHESISQIWWDDHIPRINTN
jgi:hypothetical protein